LSTQPSPKKEPSRRTTLSGDLLQTDGLCPPVIVIASLTSLVALFNTMFKKQLKLHVLQNSCISLLPKPKCRAVIGRKILRCRRLWGALVNDAGDFRNVVISDQWSSQTKDRSLFSRSQHSRTVWLSPKNLFQNSIKYL